MENVPQVLNVDIGSYKNTGKALMAFLNCKSISYPIVQVFDKEAIRPRTIVSEENTTTFGIKNIPEESVLSALLDKNDYAFNAFATLPGHPDALITMISAEMLRRINPPKNPSLKEKEFMGKLGEDLIITMKGNQDVLNECIENIGDMVRAMKWAAGKSEKGSSIDLFLQDEIKINGSKFRKDDFEKIAKETGYPINAHPYEPGVKCIVVDGDIKVNDIDCNYMFIEAKDGKTMDVVTRPRDIAFWIEECKRTAQADPYKAAGGTQLCDYIFDQRHRISISCGFMTFLWAEDVK
ncbi:hypothetical protein [Butyrivibrio proteoclasticus]|nr:hypothetical protein [Butyrivibrio proteoclasticus]